MRRLRRKNAGIRIVRERSAQILGSARNAEVRRRLGGYMGRAWSARANDALERGLRPAPMIADELGVSAEAVEAYMRSPEWHHVGEDFEEVRFFDPDEAPLTDAKDVRDAETAQSFLTYVDMFNYDTRKFSVEPRVRGKFEAEASDKAYALFTNRSTAVAKDAFAAADKLRALIEGGTATAEELRAAAEEASAAAKSGRKASDAAAKSFLSEHKDWRRVRPRRARRGANGLRYSLEEAFPATEAERAEIERSAKAKGTWLKAPNGQDTKLTPMQWVTVRTRAFKEWFGDWEKAARIEKLRDSVPVEISGREIEEGADIKSYRKNAKEYGSRLRGTYLNRDTGKRIAISMSGINEVLSHDASPSQFKSIAAIPQMVENGIYIESRENEDIKKHPDVGSYDYFVCGLKIGGADYTAKIVVANQRNGERYYDHKLTQIEKGALLSTLSAIHKAGEESNTPLSEVKDKRLLSILQVNSSKIVDENGEPLVVYHGTDADFTVFDRAKTRATMDIQGNFFSPWEDDARGYGSNVRRFFLNLRNPADENTGYHSLHEFEGQNGAGVKARERLVALGYDGVNNGGEEFIAFSPEQIKSATENVGTFDAGNPDIRYSLSMSEQAAWDGVLDAYEAGTLPQRVFHKVLNRTPVVLQRLGLKNRPITIRKETIDKIIGKNPNKTGDYHNVPIPALRELLRELDNPVAVFESVSPHAKKAIVVLTELTDEANGEKAIVPVEIDEQTGAIKSHRITSAYGRPTKDISKWIASKKILYANTKKLPNLLTADAGAIPATLPEGANKLGSEILTEKDFTQDELGVVKVNNKILRNSAGVVYGYWDEGSGELHLSEDFADFDTPLHEWAHVWLSWVRKADARLAERALAVTKETKFYKRLREDKGSAYAGLSDDALAEERGACRISSEAGFQFSPGQTAKKCPL